MAAYEELITSIYTMFCQIKSIGKTSIGYETLFKLIKTVCAWNSLRTARSQEIDSLADLTADVFYVIELRNFAKMPRSFV